VPQAPLPRNYLRLRVPEIEKAFIRVAIDLKEILVLDGIDTLQYPVGFRIHSHDLHGPLPDIVVQDTGDRYAVLDRIIRETANLIATTRIRQDLAELFPNCEFLLPTLTETGALVGIWVEGRTVFAEGSSHLEAYRELSSRAVDSFL
jgi:hypothetical protein